MRYLLLIACLVLVASCRSNRCCPPYEAPGYDAPPTPEILVPEAVPAPREVASDSELMQVLKKKRVKGLHWEEASLEMAVMYLRTITGVNFFITAGARSAMADQTITLKADDLSIAKVLDIITTEHGLAWDDKDGVVRISAKSETAAALRLRYFDVKDLTKEGASLVARIQKDVAPQTWSMPNRTLEARNGILIVRQDRRVLDAVGAYLDAIRSGKPHVGGGFTPVR